MIYLIFTLFFLWVITTGYFLKHIRHIQDEFIALDKEQHQQNMDIISLIKRDIEVTEAVNNHAKSLTHIITATEYILHEKESKKILSSGSDIFKSPKGEA